ncbi:DsbC family protein [Geobacter sp. AOG1]|uniref:DsbC family protein n=1 Tax=Geobacter sp. AOG1 TaxID=1566346 RepID=UPI001CC6CE23|nr:DsbC family protein [Geobacter sp. AOG1]GFE58270.1 protein disulfide-isomerase [Geobacter sp. AOG1]
MLKSVAPILLFLAVTGSAVGAAAEECRDTGADVQIMTISEANDLLRGIGEVKSVRFSPVQGLYELSVVNNGRQATIYVDFARKHLIPSPIFSLATKKPIAPELPVVSLPLSKVDNATVPMANSIIIGNPEGARKLFVFTDPDCPFCAKLHVELWKLTTLDPQVTIYVKMFPLKMHPAAYDKARVILGAGTPEFLNKAFAGESLPAPGPKDTAKPVDDTIKYAESIGISSTPTMILPDGRIIVGFKKAEELKALMSTVSDKGAKP